MTSIASRFTSRPSPQPAPVRRNLDRILAPLDHLLESSRQLVSKSLGNFASDGFHYSLPRYLYVGPRGGGDVLRLGIFAGIHGDEPEGALALVRFLTALEANPDLARGYALYIYPICNPTGYEDGTRHSRAGVDLNREFWTDTRHPEVRFLESEIWMQAFHGIVNLHSDDTSDGLYGFVNGTVLSEYLLEPALQAAERFLPRNSSPVIDGFQARKGVIYQSYNGVLRSPPGLEQPPFELTFETPQRSPIHLQVEAANAALLAILAEFRYLNAIAANI
jgi:murein peptide amidase A